MAWGKLKTEEPTQLTKYEPYGVYANGKLVGYATNIHAIENAVLFDIEDNSTWIGGEEMKLRDKNKATISRILKDFNVASHVFAPKSGKVKVWLDDGDYNLKMKIKSGIAKDFLKNKGNKEVMEYLKTCTTGESVCTSGDHFDPYVGLQLAITDAVLGKKFKRQLREYCEEMCK